MQLLSVPFTPFTTVYALIYMIYATLCALITDFIENSVQPMMYTQTKAPITNDIYKNIKINALSKLHKYILI